MVFQNLGSGLFQDREINGFDQGQASDTLGVFHRQPEGDVAPEGVTDDIDSLVVQKWNDRRKASVVKIRVNIPVRARAMRGKIESCDRNTREVFRHGSPHFTMGQHAVQR